MNRFVCFLAVLLVLSGCATPATQRIKVDSVAAELEAKKQREVALQSLVEDQIRITNVSYPIITKSYELCGEDTKYVTGLLLGTNMTYGEDMAEAAKSLYGLSNVEKVIYVVPNSPAAKAGIVSGDIPVRLGSWELPVGKDAQKLTQEKLTDLLKDGKPLELTLLVGQAQKNVQMIPEKACSYEVTFNSDDAVNAFADGKKVVITRGMMRFAKDDNELALVIGHELAHDSMKHMSAKTTNYVIGSIFDIIAAAYGVNTQGAFGNAAASAYSQDFEAEADYVGLYMMARAGMNIGNAPNFWRRMAAAHPGSIKTNLSASHPATPERFLALEKAVKEINEKMANGKPLKPELKNGAEAESQQSAN